MELKRTKKALLFDLDGTLLDTLEDLQAALNYALGKVGEAPVTLDQARSYVGNGMPKLVARALPGGESHPRYYECLVLMRKRYREHSAVWTRPYPGILEALNILRLFGYRIAVVSNKPERAVKRLVKRYFPGLVDVALGDVPERAKKPDPAIVRKAEELLEVKREEVLYIGDSDVDEFTAANAGVEELAVTWGFRDRAVLEANEHSFFADRTVEMAQLLTRLRAPLRVGVYGGSFDPVHKAHVAIAEAAVAALKLDLCLFVPAYKAPHKQQRTCAPPEDRCALLEAALKGRPRLRVERCELERQGISYTADTLDFLKAALEPCELFLLLGSDNYAGFKTWRHPEVIRALAQLAVYQRPGERTEIEPGDILIPGPESGLSSTEMRRIMAAGQMPRGALDERVARIIRSRGLYGLPAKNKTKGN